MYAIRSYYVFGAEGLEDFLGAEGEGMRFGDLEFHFVFSLGFV